MAPSSSGENGSVSSIRPTTSHTILASAWGERKTRQSETATKRISKGEQKVNHTVGYHSTDLVWPWEGRTTSQSHDACRSEEGSPCNTSLIHFPPQMLLSYLLNDSSTLYLTHNFSICSSAPCLPTLCQCSSASQPS